MQLNRKLLIIAKGISVWWGIYLILGCCAGFAVRMIQTVFLSLKPFELFTYLPFMCIITLILAVLTYFIGEAAKQIPVRRLRKELFEILGNEGFSSNYISKLFENAHDDMKNLCFIEAACVYCMQGEYAISEKTLSAIDMISVTDVALTTGDYRTVAYYYCVMMILNAIKGDTEASARAYDDGIHYLDMHSGNTVIMSALSLYQTKAGLYNSSMETVKKIRWKRMPKKCRKYGVSFGAYIKACNLLNMGKYDDAAMYARMSLEAPCTEYMAMEMEDIIKRARSAKHQLQN